jgi:HEAT repeat protein
MPLINTLKVNEDETILAGAVSALTQIGDQRAVEPIKELFDSKSNMVIYSVLKAVCKFKIPDSIEFIRKILKRGQQDIIYDIKDYASYAFLAVSPAEFKKSLQDELKDYHLYRLTPIILEHRDRQSAKNLLPLLTHMGVILEIAELCDLKDLQSINIIPRLTKDIKDSSMYDYMATGDALKLLARLDHDTAAELLMQLLKKVYSDYTEPVADLLVKNSSKKVSSLLIRELQNGTPRIRALSAEILGLRQEKAAVPSLIKALNEKNRKLLLNSLLALGKINDPGSIPTVARYLESQDFYIRCTAAKALLYFNTPPCVKTVKK